MSVVDSLLPSVPVLLVLKVLQGAPAHGYEIVRRVELRSEGALALKEGTLYPLLYKLEHEGLVVGEWCNEPSGRRVRVYALTEAGTGRLAETRSQWAVRARGVDRILGIREANAVGPA